MILGQNFEFAALQEAKNYRRAIVREFEGFLRGRVLEIGAGIGQISAVVASQPDVQHVLAVEPDEKFVQQFQRSSPKIQILHGTADRVDDRDWNALLSVNVLEHIQDDSAELSRYQKLLAPENGFLCLLVPARPELYSPIDRDFGHFRRYCPVDLRTKLIDAGMEIVRLSYFNFIGYFAWAISFRIFGRRSFNASAVRLFDRFVFPVGYAVERALARPPLGQSLIAVARSKSE